MTFLTKYVLSADKGVAGNWFFLMKQFRKTNLTHSNLIVIVSKGQKHFFLCKDANTILNFTLEG